MPGVHWLQNISPTYDDAVVKNNMKNYSQAAQRTTWALTSTPVLGPLLVSLYGVTMTACLVIVMIIIAITTIITITIILKITRSATASWSPLFWLHPNWEPRATPFLSTLQYLVRTMMVMKLRMKITITTTTTTIIIITNITITISRHTPCEPGSPSDPHPALNNCLGLANRSAKFFFIRREFYLAEQRNVLEDVLTDDLGRNSTFQSYISMLFGKGFKSFF